MKELIKELDLEAYVVEDILAKDVEYIFILESPHIDEVEKKIPVVGKSGKSMSRILFEKDEPFGLLIKDDNNKNIGIMNISKIPLQASAYRCDVMNSKSCKQFRLMELIRKNSQKSIEDNGLMQKISNDFKNRIENIDGYQNKKYILCGKFAKKVFMSLENQPNSELILSVPHPAFNNWVKAKYKDEIKELKNFLNLPSMEKP